MAPKAALVLSLSVLLRGIAFAETCGAQSDPGTAVLIEEGAPDRHNGRTFDLDVSASVRIPADALSLQKLVEDHDFWNRHFRLIGIAKSEAISGQYSARVSLPMGLHKTMILTRVLKDSEKGYQLFRAADATQACIQVSFDSTNSSVLRLNFKSDLSFLARKMRGKIIEAIRQELMLALQKIKDSTASSPKIKTTRLPTHGI